MKVMIMRSRGVHHSQGDALQVLQMSKWHEMEEQRDGEQDRRGKYRVNLEKERSYSDGMQLQIMRNGCVHLVKEVVCMYCS